MVETPEILRLYAEATRYMQNAENVLQNSDKDNNNYLDAKYVRMACGTAYLAVLMAVDMWLAMRGVPMPAKRDQKKKHRDINMYRMEVGKRDRGVLTALNTTYNILHLAGYYDGEQNVTVIRGGFTVAYSIIERIKPAMPDAELQTYIDNYKFKKPSFLQQIFSFLF
jgi:hypothetical protein